MKTCPYCAEEIQDAAIVCKHCGRDLGGAAPPSPPSTPAPKKTNPAAMGCLALLAIVLVFVVIGALNNSGPSKAPAKSMGIHVAWNAVALQITNDTVPAGTELIVYLNDTPPSGYKYTGQMPAPGEVTRLPLTQFVRKDGTRFNPLTTAVTVAWVGGGGYDYASYATR